MAKSLQFTFVAPGAEENTTMTKTFTDFDDSISSATMSKAGYAFVDNKSFKNKYGAITDLKQIDVIERTITEIPVDAS